MDEDRENKRRILEAASEHMIQYYGFHWPPEDLRILATDEKGIAYVSHWQMRGVLLTVKLNKIAHQCVVRSYKHQYVRASSYNHVDSTARLREKGYLNGNA